MSSTPHGLRSRHPLPSLSRTARSSQATLPQSGGLRAACRVAAPWSLMVQGECAPLVAQAG